MSSKRVTNRFPRRGYVYQVRFDPARGHEIKKTRPAVIVSNDHMNELAATILVMPITTGKYEYFLRIPITPPEGGLKRNSVVATEQIRAIDKRRVGKKLGKLKPFTMFEIERAIRDHFGLPEGDVMA